MATVLVALVAAAGSGGPLLHRQRTLNVVEQLPPVPTPVRLLNWRDRARDLDAYLFHTAEARARGLYYEVDGSKVRAPNWNGTSFGIPSYANDTRYGPHVHSESLPVLGAVLGGAMVGVFNGSRAAQALSVYFIPSRPTQWSAGSPNFGVWSDNPLDCQPQGSSWYQLAPNIFAMATIDAYARLPGAPALPEDVVAQAVTAAGRWTAMAEALQFDFNHTGFDWPKMAPYDNGVWKEADGGAGVAWVALAGHALTGRADMLAAAVKSVQYLDTLDHCPLYEMLLPWGVSAAARLVAGGHVDVDLHKLLDWCMTGDAWVRLGWGVESGSWGNQSVGGLMGSQIDGAGYAFYANTVWTVAALLPVARHAPEFADAIAKFAVAASNNARLFYGDQLGDRQSGEADFDPRHLIPYEGLRRCDFGRPQGKCLHGFQWGPFGTGQNCGDEGVRAGSGLCCPSPPCDDGVQTEGTDAGLYGGTFVGLLGATVASTDNPLIPRLDVTATDFFAGSAHPTFLYRNPLGSVSKVAVQLDNRTVGAATFALYSPSMSGADGGCPTALLVDNVPAGSGWTLTLPPQETRTIVAVPAGSHPDRQTDGSVQVAGITVCRPPRGASPTNGSVNVLRRFSYPPALYPKGCGKGGDPDSWMSDFDFNFNAAVATTDDGQPHLLIRTQSSSDTSPCTCGTSGRAPDVLTHTTLAEHRPEWEPPAYHRVTNASVVLRPATSCDAIDVCGVQDPRAVTVAGTTYVWYTAYGYIDGVKSARLALATTTDVADPGAYRKEGAVFPELRWSKSGAVLPNAFARGTRYGATPHLMLWGDSGGGPVPESQWGIRAAVASSLKGPWTNLNLTTNPQGLFLPTRPDAFDSELVEAGPPPVRLSTGDYLFVYNSARRVPAYEAWKPYPLRYNVGWAILDRDNPTVVLERSATPLWSPAFWYETGGRRIGDNQSWGFFCSAAQAGTPNVVFVEGMHPLAAPDTFRVVAAGADFALTTVDITVTPPSRGESP